MLRTCKMLALLWLGFPMAARACECISIERPCGYIRGGPIFIGRVVETVPVKHPMEKGSWTSGYSMRFAVEETLSGDFGTEAVIETGNGGGDCGTPLRPGDRFLIFAYKDDKDGKFWTGMCSGSRQLTGDPGDDKLVDEYRTLSRTGVGTVFGRVVLNKPVWRENDVDYEREVKPYQGVVVHAHAAEFSAVAKTAKDGSYEFPRLPTGKYTIVPDLGGNLDLDHEYEDRYKADIVAGRCANIDFKLEPSTRIRGHVTRPDGIGKTTLEVVALPIHMGHLNQFSGKTDFTDENDRFDLWPLPPGDYYVGVNINNSPKSDAPFPPTFYPGVTNQNAASIVHIEEGEIKELELPLLEIAKPRAVHFVAIGLDGKPLRAIYVQLEDLRHPGDAGSYVNVDLDSSGAGTLTVYSGYSYHLHGSHWVSYGNDWCSKPVDIPAGTDPVSVRFVMSRKEANCEISEIDGLKRH